MGAESNGMIFDDLEWPVTRTKSNISKMVRFRDKGTKTLIENHAQSIEWYHFQWPWVTSNPISMSRHISTSNISETTQDRAIVTNERQ